MTTEGTAIPPYTAAQPKDTTKQEEKPGEENRKTSNDNQCGPSADFSALIDTIRQEAKANRDEESREDRGKRFREYLTLMLVFITAAAVIYQAFIFSGQLDEMKSSGEQTGQLIENNAKLAGAAGKQAEAAEKQAVAMSEYAKVTRDSLIAAQRAWVGPRNIKSSRAPVLDEPLDIILEYQNTGRDPATETIKATDIFTGTDEEDRSGIVPDRINNFISECKIMWKPQAANVVYPSTGLGTPYTLSVNLKGSLIDADVVAGTKNIWAAGCFVYKTFNTIHRSWFCYYFKNGIVKPESWAICEIGNGAD